MYPNLGKHAFDIAKVRIKSRSRVARNTGYRRDGDLVDTVLTDGLNASGDQLFVGVSPGLALAFGNLRLIHDVNTLQRKAFVVPVNLGAERLEIFKSFSHETGGLDACHQC